MSRPPYREPDEGSSLAVIGLVLFAVVLVAILLSGCATPPVAVPHAPGFGVVSVAPDRDGFIVTPDKRSYLISKGVPTEWFIPVASDYFLSAEHEAEAADILLKDRNP